MSNRVLCDLCDKADGWPRDCSAGWAGAAEDVQALDVCEECLQRPIADLMAADERMRQRQLAEEKALKAMEKARKAVPRQQQTEANAP